MNATKEDILACFRLLLGREPHLEEIKDHFARVGAPLESVLPIYLQSLEFQSRGLLRSCDEGEIIPLDGFSIFVAKNDPLIAPGIRMGYEPEVTRAFLEHMGTGTVLDIGANCGYFSLLAAARGATVYAFEPLQQNIRLLTASRALNGFERLHLIAAAASDVPQTLMIAATYTNGMVGVLPADPGVALAADYAAAVRIDDMIPRDVPVSLIKIDVEGHEHPAITGAAETIRRSRPVIISEFSPSLLGSAAAYLDLLRSFGYRLSAIGWPDVTTNQELLQIPAGVDHIDILAMPL